jgi:hypothetical protein
MGYKNPSIEIKNGYHSHLLALQKVEIIPYNADEKLVIITKGEDRIQKNITNSAVSYHYLEEHPSDLLGFFLLFKNIYLDSCVKTLFTQEKKDTTEIK